MDVPTAMRPWADKRRAGVICRHLLVRRHRKREVLEMDGLIESCSEVTNVYDIRSIWRYLCV